MSNFFAVVFLLFLTECCQAQEKFINEQDVWLELIDQSNAILKVKLIKIGDASSVVTLGSGVTRILEFKVIDRLYAIPKILNHKNESMKRVLYSSYTLNLDKERLPIAEGREYIIFLRNEDPFISQGSEVYRLTNNWIGIVESFADGEIKQALKKNEIINKQ